MQTNPASHFSPFQVAFLVASDEPEWAKRGFPRDFEFPIFYSEDYHTELRDSEVDLAHFDFAVLTLCQNSIFSIGTFGFWSSYLAGGRTILGKNKRQTVRFLIQSFDSL